MLTTIALVVLAVLVVLFGYAATRPATFRVERSTRIAAPAERIFPLIDDFHRWPAWSPWEKLDPGMTRTYSGADSGAGAVYEWSGTKKVGSGRMEILRTTPPAKVVIKLDFITPFEGHNTTEFTIAGTSGGTTVTWTMYGPNAYMMRVMGIFMNFDTMIGKDFEAGLANMKAVAEG